MFTLWPRFFLFSIGCDQFWRIKNSARPVNQRERDWRHDKEGSARDSSLFAHGGRGQGGIEGKGKRGEKQKVEKR